MATADGDDAVRELGSNSTGAVSAPTLSWEQKYQQAKEYKEAGNEKYRNKMHKAAISKYHRALLYLKGIENTEQAGSLIPGVGQGNMSPRLPPQALEDVKRLKVDCYNNIAACMLQAESPMYEKIVQHCDSVLELNPNNVKAMYRKAVSLYHLKDPEIALEILLSAQSKPGGANDKNIERYIQLSQKAVHKQDQKMKDTYKAMFDTSGSQKQTETESKDTTENTSSSQ